MDGNTVGWVQQETGSVLGDGISEELPFIGGPKG